MTAAHMMAYGISSKFIDKRKNARKQLISFASDEGCEVFFEPLCFVFVLAPNLSTKKCLQYHSFRSNTLATWENWTEVCT
uniref:Uncharacterized protein n=1 Tax=Rhizophora mucronata TaxID=61149 RepID=A0A2P2QJ83_RHIMU